MKIFEAKLGCRWKALVSADLLLALSADCLDRVNSLQAQAKRQLHLVEEKWKCADACLSPSAFNLDLVRSWIRLKQIRDRRVVIRISSDPIPKAISVRRNQSGSR